jgi:hypothetical protein
MDKDKDKDKDKDMDKDVDKDKDLNNSKFLINKIFIKDRFKIINKIFLNQILIIFSFNKINNNFNIRCNKNR